MTVLVRRHGTGEPGEGAAPSPPSAEIAALGSRTEPSRAVDLPHPDDAARGRFARPGPFRLDALAWAAPGDPDPLVGLPGAFEPLVHFHVTPHLGWKAADAGAVDATGVVRQVSFLYPAPGVSPEEFRRHYRHHVEVARRHMPSLWQYVQNDVMAIGGPGAWSAGDVVAISELWFRTCEDFLERYFPTPDDATQFRSQEGFLDLGRAFSFICTTHPCAPGTHHGQPR